MEAFYKLSILIVLFIQTFPFQWNHFSLSEKEKNSRKYTEVMKYFVIITSFIFLVVTMLYDFIILFLGKGYHDERGFVTVSILLANLFLGIYYNLSVWYKLSEKTKYGAYMSIFWALITLSLNFLLIPILGFIDLFETLWFVIYVCQLFLSIWAENIIEFPYPIKRIFMYLGLVSFYFLQVYCLI